MMTDVKALVGELLQLLVSDVDTTNIYNPPSSPRIRSNRPRISIKNPYQSLSKYDLWSRLDEILFPFLSYNMKVSMVPQSKGKKTTLLNAFVKANIASEAACAYSCDHLLPIALYEVATSTLSGDKSYNSSSSSVTHSGVLVSNPEKRRKGYYAAFHLPGVGMIINNKHYEKSSSNSSGAATPTSSAVNLERLNSSLLTPPADMAYFPEEYITVHFRRITRSRLQACCTIPAIVLPKSSKIGNSHDETAFDFVWESSAISGEPNWKLRRFGFADSDDEEHYWRPWETSIEEAEADYLRFQEQDYKADLAPLDVSDIEWDSMTSSTTPSDVDSLSSNSWSSHNFESLPAINNSNVPSKKSLEHNGICYDISGPRKSNNNSNNNVNSNPKHKYLGKSIGNDFYNSAIAGYYTTSFSGNNSSSSARAYNNNNNNNFSSSSGNAGSKRGIHSNKVAPNYNSGHEWGHDDHHNHYESMEIDYEDDYSYKQAHPIFQHPIASVYEYDDEDDIFGVCHSMAPPVQQQQQQFEPKAPSVATAAQKAAAVAASAVSVVSETKSSTRTGTTGSSGTATPTLNSTINTSSKIIVGQQQPANATATKTQPHTEPLLQRVCDGDDDDEAAYWDRYDDFV